MIENIYRYYAFISYKREDEKWAKWLQHKLEHYKLPTNLNGRTDLPNTIRPIFKDTTELAPGNLPEQIRQALEDSKYLIVICSPRSAKSNWVNKEAETFMDMGRTDKIIPFIIEGTAHAKNITEEAFPPALLQLTEEKELLGANINEMGRDAAAVKVVARMFNVRFDELWQRHEREKRKHRRLILASVMALFLVALGVAFWMYLQRQETLRANWKMMENQARVVADKAKEEVKNGNTYDAMLALLEMSPLDGSRPFVAELDEALRIAYDSLRAQRWNYRAINDIYNIVRFSRDSKFFICTGRNTIDIYEAETLHKIAKIKIPYKEETQLAYFSDDNDMVYLLDNMDVIYYHIPDGKLVRKSPFVEETIEQCMADFHQFVIGMKLHWVSEWKKGKGLPDDAIILDYNPIRHIALCNIPDDLAIGSYKSVLYDCNRKKTIKGTDGRSFDSIVSGVITGSSFSADGKFLAMAFDNGKGVILDMDDLSARPFYCGNPNCAHLSNWLNFGNNGQLLHGSKFDNLKIYDGQSLALVDSIPVSGYSDGMNDNGDICLISGKAVFYRLKEERHQTPAYHFSKIDFPSFVTDTIVNKRFHILCDDYLSFSDKNGEFKDWHIKEVDPEVSQCLRGFIQDYRYLLVLREGNMGYQFSTDIIDMKTGTVIYRIKDYADCLYYDEEHEIIAMGNDEKHDMEGMISFPSFENLVRLCRKATRGMEMSDDSRKKFYISR